MTEVTVMRRGLLLYSGGTMIEYNSIVTPLAYQGIISKYESMQEYLNNIL